MHAKGTTTGKLYAFGFAITFLLGVFAFPGMPSAQAQTTGTTLQFTDLHYTPLTAQTSVYGDPAAVYVKATHASSSPAPEARPGLAVWSVKRGTGTTTIPCTTLTDRLDTGWTIDLLETGPTTGVFVGSFKVTTSEAATTGTAGDPASFHAAFGKIGGEGLLRVEEGGKICMSRTFTTGSPLTDEVVWHASRDSRLSVSRDNDPSAALAYNIVPTAPAQYAGLPAAATLNGYGRSLIFALYDHDLLPALNAVDEATNVIVVRSDSDRDGEQVTLVESAGSPPTADPEGAANYLFGTIGFENFDFPNNGKVFAQHGDRVWIELTDRAGVDGQPHVFRFPPKPSPTDPTDFWTFLSTSDATIQWQASPLVSTRQVGGVYANPGVVLVRDLDFSLSSSGAETPPVTITSRAPGSSTPRDTLVFDLKERGGLTGDFLGAVTFTEPGTTCPSTPANDVPKCIDVVHGDVLRAEYTDTDLVGTVRTRTNEVTFVSGDSGRVGLGPDALVSVPAPSLLVGTSSFYDVEVQDNDANRNPLSQETVRVQVKSTSDPSTLNLDLLETSQNSGTFVASLGFTTGATGGNRIRVADRDQVIVHYSDSITRSGLPGRVSSNVVTWRASDNAEVFLDSNEYIQSMTGSGSFGPTANVIILDDDRNDPFRRDMVRVALVVPGTQSGGTFDALESGVDTGVFLAQVPFGAGAGQFDPGAGATRQIRAEYTDAFTTGGLEDVALSAESTWISTTFSSTRLLARFEQSDVLAERATILYHPDFGTPLESTVDVVQYAAAPAALGVASTRCGTFTIPAGNFDDRPDGSRRWTATLKLSTSPSTGTASEQCTNLRNAGFLGINSGDTVRVVGSSTVDHAVVRGWAMEITAKDRLGAANAPRIYGYQQPGYLYVTGGVGNDHNLARDVIALTAATFDPITGVSATTITVPAVETDVDSGVFVASIGAMRPATGSEMQDALRLSIDQPREPVHVHNGAQDQVKTYTDVLEPSFIYVKIPRAAATNFAKDVEGGLTWFPADQLVAGSPVEAGLDILPGLGASQPFTVTVRDAKTAGHQRFELTSNGDVNYNLPSAVQNTYTLVYAEVTGESGTLADINGVGQHSLGVATSDASGFADVRQALADSNGDGTIECGDVTFSRANMYCTSTPLELTQGTLKFIDECRTSGGIGGIGGSTCSYTVSYLYRGIPSTWVGDGVATTTDHDDVFHFRMSSASTLQFGAAVPAGRKIIVESRATTLPVQFTSKNTLESDSVSLPLVTSGDLKGFYSGSLPTETTAGANNGRAFVRPGTNDKMDVLTFSYADSRLPDGSAGVVQADHLRSRLFASQWFTVETGQVSFRSVDLASAAVSPFFGPYIPVQIRDADADTSAQPDKLTAQARNSADATDTVAVTLWETGARTGVFVGVVPVSTDAEGNDAEVNLPDTGGNVVVTYADQRGSLGTLQNPSGIITWRPSKSGAPIVTVSTTIRASCSVAPDAPPAKISGTDQALFVEVCDADANQDSLFRETIKVVVSTATDPTGAEINLLETSPSSGLFRSSEVRFGPTAGTDRVRALDLQGSGETVLVSYADPKNAKGVRQSFSPASVPLWERTFDGAVTFDQPAYIGLITANSPAKAVNNFSVVYVTDGDLNLDATAVDSPSVKVDVFRINPTTGEGPGAGEFAAQALQLDLFETGANTGVFFGRHSFVQGDTSGPEPAPPLTTVGSVAVGATVPAELLIRAQYSDATDSRGRASAFTGEADWVRAGVGVLQLDQPTYTTLGTGRVTLYDGHLDTATNSKQTQRVQVRSQASPTGINLDLLETGDSTGIFTATFTMISGATTGTSLKVGNTDEVQVTYADSSPAGTRTGSAFVRIADVTPPVTTIETTTTPTGLRGVFKAPTSLTFDVDEIVDRTMVKINGSDPREWDGEPILLGPGVHVIEAWSVDLAGKDESADGTVPMRTIIVDLNGVTATPGGLVGTAVVGGDVLVSWTDVAQRNDPLEFYEYIVYRDESATPIGNSTTNKFLDTNLTDESPHTYRVAISDTAGNVGPKSGSVSVTPDATAPTLTAPLLTPLGFDTRAKPNGVTVRVGASDANLDYVEAKIVKSSGEALVTANLTLTSGTTYSGTLPVTAIDQPCTCKLLVTAFDKAGNSKSLEFTYIITGPDSELPTAVLPAVQINLGSPLAVSVSDNVAISKVSYTLDGAPPVVVTVNGRPSTMTFEVPASILTLGAHTLVVEVEDNATAPDGSPAPNKASITLAFTVLEAGTVPPSSFFLPTTVSTRSDGSIVVAWEVPQGVTGVAGFQVWRSSSPFALVGNVSNPSERSFIDTSAVAGTVYRYVVTFYTSSPFASIAQVPGYTSDDQVPASAPIQSDEGGGLPGWLMTVLIVGAFVVVAAIIAIFVASRRSSAPPQTVQTNAPPPAEVEPQPQRRAIAMETHRLRCPQCSHRFEVSGTKPIVTNCPNCGRKGILR